MIKAESGFSLTARLTLQTPTRQPVSNFCRWSAESKQEPATSSSELCLPNSCACMVFRTKDLAAPGSFSKARHARKQRARPKPPPSIFRRFRFLLHLFGQLQTILR